MKRVVCCDLDGTLCDTFHRQHYVRTKPKNWKAWNATIPFDLPHADIKWLVSLLRTAGYEIFLVSGRGAENREVTEKWLETYKIGYDRLYMRPANDHRPDDIIKKEILDEIRADGIEPYFVLDDRDSVVKMWRDNGVRCLQVANGDF